MSSFIEQIYYKQHDYSGVIFLDRDGTINKQVANLIKKQQVEILPKVIDSIKLLNKFNIAVVVITNQPLIARGIATIKQVEEINTYLVEKIYKRGGVINAIYSCPHHPEKNHPDIPPSAMKFRMNCNCRKPNTAMFSQAIKKFDSKRLLGMIGDHERDIIAGKKLKIPTVYLKTDSNKYDTFNSVVPDYICNNLLDAVRKLL